MGGNSRGGKFQADVEVDGAKVTGTVQVDANQFRPLQLKKNLSAAGEDAREIKLHVRGPKNETVFQGDWKFTPGLEPKGRPPREREKPFPAQVNYAAEAKAIRFWADLLDYPKRDKLAAARVTVYSITCPCSM